MGFKWCSNGVQHEVQMGSKCLHEWVMATSITAEQSIAIGKANQPASYRGNRVRLAMGARAASSPQYQYRSITSIQHNRHVRRSMWGGLCVSNVSFDSYTVMITSTPPFPIPKTAPAWIDACIRQWQSWSRWEGRRIDTSVYCHGWNMRFWMWSLWSDSTWTASCIYTMAWCV